MLARVQSYLLQGIDALPCEIELDHDPNYLVPEGGRSVFLVGLPDAGVREAQERVRSALANSGWYFPTGKVVINMAPADVRKEGSVYDLAIAVGLLAVQGVVGRAPARQMANGKSHMANGEDEAEGLDYRGLVIAGELALDGRVRPIRGALALTAMAKARGAKGVMVPADNAAEAAVVGGIDVYGVRTLAEAVGILTGNLDTPPCEAPDVVNLLRTAAAPIDFAEVRGQEGVKRAITIAAAGNHNLLGIGPSGSNGGGPPVNSPVGSSRRSGSFGNLAPAPAAPQVDRTVGIGPQRGRETKGPMRIVGFIHRQQVFAAPHRCGRPVRTCRTLGILSMVDLTRRPANEDHSS